MGYEIVLLGPPGAGKGTHAGAVSERYKVPHISTGDMLREFIREKKPLGLEAKAFMDRGELVPDSVVISMVKERLLQPDAKKGFLLDGFPRNPDQARSLDKILKEIGRELKTVLYVTSEKALILKRLSGRRVCEGCGKVYNIPNYMPKVEGVCDVCKAKLIQRKDDREETVLNRLRVYEEQTSSLIDYYKQKGLLQEINGNLEFEGTQAQIESVFGELQRAK